MGLWPLFLSPADCGDREASPAGPGRVGAQRGERSQAAVEVREPEEDRPIRLTEVGDLEIFDGHSWRPIASLLSDPADGHREDPSPGDEAPQ
jgi:hypothetical protein